MNDLTPCQMRVFRKEVFTSCDAKSTVVCVACGNHVCRRHSHTARLSYKVGSFTLSSYDAPICDTCAIKMVDRAQWAAEA